jgi:hypothetical protein
MKRRKPQVARTLKKKPDRSALPGSVVEGIKIPAILFESDQCESAPATEPVPEDTPLGSAIAAQVSSGPAELPEAYGTGRMHLLVRDPHCLYAHWDLTSAQLKQHEALSADAGLVVRCHRDEANGPLAAECPMPAGARHGFLTVPAAGAQYVAELGYYGVGRQWVLIAVSEPVTTPHETASEDRTFELAAVPPWPGRHAWVPTIVEPITPPRVGWIPALGVGSGALGQEQTPGPGEPPEAISGEWSEAQERALEELMGLDTPGPDALSSVDLV